MSKTQKEDQLTPGRDNSASQPNDGEVGPAGIDAALADFRIKEDEADDDFIIKTYRKPKSP